MMTPDIDSVLYLWSKRTLYIGDLLGLVTLNPASASLLVALEGEFQFWTPAHGKVSTSIALIPAGATVSIDHGNRLVACSLLDPMSDDFQQLEKIMISCADGIHYGASNLQSLRDCFRTIYRDKLPAGSAHDHYVRHVFPESPIQTAPAKHYDAIKRVVAIIKTSPEDNPSNEELAGRVGLSATQLQRTFKSVIGVPIRRYRLWYRLFVTAAFMAHGLSLTEACLEAGFSDASHFNHTFKSMLGIKPSHILKRRHQIQIMLGSVCHDKLLERLPA